MKKSASVRDCSLVTRRNEGNLKNGGSRQLNHLTSAGCLVKLLYSNTYVVDVLVNGGLSGGVVALTCQAEVVYHYSILEAVRVNLKRIGSSSR